MDLHLKLLAPGLGTWTSSEYRLWKRIGLCTGTVGFYHIPPCSSLEHFFALFSLLSHEASLAVSHVRVQSSGAMASVSSFIKVAHKPRRMISKTFLPQQKDCFANLKFVWYLGHNIEWGSDRRGSPSRRIESLA